MQWPSLKSWKARAHGTYTGNSSMTGLRDSSIVLPQCPHAALHGARRSTLSPRKLVATYPPPDEHVHTLYDNWETAVARFPHVRGNLGPIEAPCKHMRLLLPWPPHASAI